MQLYVYPFFRDSVFAVMWREFHDFEFTIGKGRRQKGNVIVLAEMVIYVVIALLAAARRRKERREEIENEQVLHDFRPMTA
jgi:hypothetical protein